jgi:hypothetical protein
MKSGGRRGESCNPDLRNQRKRPDSWLAACSRFGASGILWQPIRPRHYAKRAACAQPTSIGSGNGPAATCRASVLLLQAMRFKIE